MSEPKNGEKQNETVPPLSPEDENIGAIELADSDKVQALLKRLQGDKKDLWSKRRRSVWAHNSATISSIVASAFITATSFFKWDGQPGWWEEVPGLLSIFLAALLAFHAAWPFREKVRFFSVGISEADALETTLELQVKTQKDFINILTKRNALICRMAAEIPRNESSLPELIRPVQGTAKPLSS